ncbi:3-keto-5-aminohexanoate cleavage protein [Streptomyces albidus (ex Kaewkla and Franco 2022)]|uniref:3-keto-5-aminohexanoate cleavage protein n=1 Tax=Streptomyces albidus (ex Kaewkla and Franco 2022) TaxID=722709 RepID=UPI0015EFC395|nr:3-keto-5-aminohexanoate cleavage protein [Streptomyces albidus (ex Kaewkla and Franco 2022)]
MLQVCLNGARDRSACPSLPVTAEELAGSARAAVAAGARDIHLHPKNTSGEDTLESAVVAEALTAVRAAVPGIPVGVTTGAWATPDPEQRAAQVRSWTVLPDHASVNWHEPGASLVAAALLSRGIGVEAGVWSGTDAVRHLLDWPERHRVLRILAEVTDTGTRTAPHTAAALVDELRPADSPVLLHGEDGGAWPVLRLAALRGLDMRVGLEDVLHLPDGTPAEANADLVLAARVIRQASQPR